MRGRRRVDEDRSAGGRRAEPRLGRVSRWARTGRRFRRRQPIPVGYKLPPTDGEAGSDSGQVEDTMPCLKESQRVGRPPPGNPEALAGRALRGDLARAQAAARGVAQPRAGGDPHACRRPARPSPRRTSTGPGPAWRSEPAGSLWQHGLRGGRTLAAARAGPARYAEMSRPFPALIWLIKLRR